MLVWNIVFVVALERECSKKFPLWKGKFCFVSFSSKIMFFSPKLQMNSGIRTLVADMDFDSDRIDGAWYRFQGRKYGREL